MARVAIFLDGGYLRELQVDYGLFAERVRDRIASETAEQLDILRTYYYDCPPHQSSSPTPESSRRWLFHGPRRGADGRAAYSSVLYREADARAEMDAAFMRSAARAPA